MTVSGATKNRVPSFYRFRHFQVGVLDLINIEAGEFEEHGMGKAAKALKIGNP